MKKQYLRNTELQASSLDSNCQCSDKTIRIKSCCDNCCQNESDKTISLESISLEEPTSSKYIKTKTKSDNVHHNYVTKNELKCQRCVEGPRKYRPQNQNVVPKRSSRKKSSSSCFTSNRKQATKYKNLYEESRDVICQKYFQMFNKNNGSECLMQTVEQRGTGKVERGGTEQRSLATKREHNDTTNERPRKSIKVIVCDDKTCGVSCCCAAGCRDGYQNSGSGRPKKGLETDSLHFGKTCFNDGNLNGETRNRFDTNIQGMPNYSGETQNNRHEDTAVVYRRKKDSNLGRRSTHNTNRLQLSCSIKISKNGYKDTAANNGRKTDSGIRTGLAPEISDYNPTVYTTTEDKNNKHRGTHDVLKSAHHQSHDYGNGKNKSLLQSQCCLHETRRKEGSLQSQCSLPEPREKEGLLQSQCCLHDTRIKEGLLQSQCCLPDTRMKEGILQSQCCLPDTIIKVGLLQSQCCLPDTKDTHMGGARPKRSKNYKDYEQGMMALEKNSMQKRSYNSNKLSQSQHDRQNLKESEKPRKPSSNENNGTLRHNNCIDREPYLTGLNGDNGVRPKYDRHEGRGSYLKGLCVRSRHNNSRAEGHESHLTVICGDNGAQPKCNYHDDRESYLMCFNEDNNVRSKRSYREGRESYLKGLSARPRRRTDYHENRELYGVNRYSGVQRKRSYNKERVVYSKTDTLRTRRNDDEIRRKGNDNADYRAYKLKQSKTYSILNGSKNVKDSKSKTNKTPRGCDLSNTNRNSVNVKSCLDKHCNKPYSDTVQNGCSDKENVKPNNRNYKNLSDEKNIDATYDKLCKEYELIIGKLRGNKSDCNSNQLHSTWDDILNRTAAGNLENASCNDIQYDCCESEQEESIPDESDDNNNDTDCSSGTNSSDYGTDDCGNTVYGTGNDSEWALDSVGEDDPEDLTDDDYCVTRDINDDIKVIKEFSLRQMPKFENDSLTNTSNSQFYSVDIRKRQFSKKDLSSNDEEEGEEEVEEEAEEEEEEEEEIEEDPCNEETELVSDDSESKLNIEKKFMTSCIFCNNKIRERMLLLDHLRMKMRNKSLKVKGRTCSFMSTVQNVKQSVSFCTDEIRKERSFLDNVVNKNRQSLKKTKLPVVPEKNENESKEKQSKDKQSYYKKQSLHDRLEDDKSKGNKPYDSKRKDDKTEGNSHKNKMSASVPGKSNMIKDADIVNVNGGGQRQQKRNHYSSWSKPKTK